ncbi:hypothetical protein [uncultured Algoriphagus sp.]|uniref:hypothetical protein n=1 Tax=uncultured Algoriphagus sp. TaxID=417365 RepID=UPI0030EF3730|tara:strand:+ start:14379 stop:15095 length:717 start_codon:yes stop_codon:yes gene_type:complete
MENNKPLRIFEVSSRIGILIQDLIKALRESGVEAYNSPNFILDSSHIDIISDFYVRSVKDSFSYTKKNRHIFSSNREDLHKKFYSQFIPEFSPFSHLDNGFDYESWDKVINEFTLERVLEFELDETLIRSHFYISVYQEYSPVHKKYFNTSKLLRLRLRLKSIGKIFDLNKRDQISALINFGNYHTFSSEEDHKHEAFPFNSFSFMVKSIREAKIISAINFSFNHEKTSRINTKNTIL